MPTVSYKAFEYKCFIIIQESFSKRYIYKCFVNVQYNNILFQLPNMRIFFSNNIVTFLEEKIINNS